MSQTPPLTAGPEGWADSFKTFTLLHFASVAFFAFLMIGACYLGHCWRETPKEARFRRYWGWIVLVYQIWYSIWYVMPYRFDWRESLPLQLCDIAAFIAAFAMITHWRPWRTLLYFWGIGLSTQAFFTPTLQFGPAHLKFWMFWIGHTMIVGSAMYDIVVCGYRPSFRDFWQALSTTYTLCLTVFFFDVVLSSLVGMPINYWYIGDSLPNNPSILDPLGPWPVRVVWLILIVITDFTLLWLLWPALRALGVKWAEPRAKS